MILQHLTLHPTLQSHPPPLLRILLRLFLPAAIDLAYTPLSRRLSSPWMLPAEVGRLFKEMVKPLHLCLVYEGSLLR